MIIILITGIVITPNLGEVSIFIFCFFIFFWSVSFAIYFGVIKEGVDYIDEKEVKNLLKFLDKKEVFDYIRELIEQRSINNLRYIGIEIDAKFNTSITQKKGMRTGLIRDDWLYDKIEALYEKIINEKKKES
jgi:hypothetical protein